MDAQAVPLPEVMFPTGEQRPALGLGTWRMGEDPRLRRAEVGALRLALEMGYRVIDTAEMYGDGGAEAVVGEALAAAQREGCSRDELFVVTKVLPTHAQPQAMLEACERSLRRLGLDRVDLYLLHWRGAVPLAETVCGFEQLQRRGWIRLWGVSNFDPGDLRELTAVPGGAACAANQVYFSLSQRGVESDLLAWQRLHQMPLMAYCPLDQGELVDHPALRPVAARHGVTPAQLALAWVLHRQGVMAIPKAGQALHLRQDWAAGSLQLSAADLAEIDRAFPLPPGPRPLAMR
jgi:diketogulonate reductase-like aldo/keto reductase